MHTCTGKGGCYTYTISGGKCIEVLIINNSCGLTTLNVVNEKLWITYVDRRI